MPSLFSRSRTQSTPTKSKNATLPATPSRGAGSSTDEFGRVNSRGALGGTFSSATKRSKKDKGGSSKEHEQDLPPLPETGFLPLSDGPGFASRVSLDGREPLQAQGDYGYLSHERDVVLGLPQVARLIDVLTEEIASKGLKTPFLFSSLALDLSQHRVRRLIDAFMRTCRSPTGEAEDAWREEAHFAGPHELGVCLRWGLARLERRIDGEACRGMLAWETYLRWREDESAALHPPAHFTEFLPALEPLVRTTLLELMTLFMRLTAHATTSGLTPQTLSATFGTLLFGIGMYSHTFHAAYVHYLRATHAFEHLLLSFIRLQDAQATGTLAIPARVKDWIRGYPSMVAPMEQLEKPRNSVRTLRVTSVRRNVRMYSADLVRTGSTWANRSNAFSNSKDWLRISPKSPNVLAPRYTDRYRQRMDLPATALPDSTTSASSPAISQASTLSSASTATLVDSTEETRFRSLTDLKWGEFEAIGFGSGDVKRLQFDLTEGARLERAQKRSTMTWNDFSEAGFSRTDRPLATTLQFDAPLNNTISSWQAHSAERDRKLKKTHRALPAFGWDTDPVLGGEELIEEAFMDTFCDLLYGSGWIERGEPTFRESNWALVEFKATNGVARSPGSSTDPRTSSCILLFEEFVPQEYQSQLAGGKRKLPTLFSPSKSWKPAATLNGRPYVIGSVPRPTVSGSSAREAEFEGLIKSNNSTKVLSLGPSGTMRAAISRPLFTSPRSEKSEVSAKPLPDTAEPPRTPTATRRSKFKLGTPGNRRGGMLVPAEYDSVDFETRLASYSDDELNSGIGGKSEGHNRAQSKDDAWVDILVASSSRRLGSQDARLKSGHSDPELAREEVAAALAAVRNHTFESTEDINVGLPRTSSETYDRSDDDYDQEGSGTVESEAQLAYRGSADDIVQEDDEIPSPLDVPDLVNDEETHKAREMPHSRADSALLPPDIGKGIAAAGGKAASSPRGGAVSAMVEMYRKREQESSPMSKIPVRSGSVPKDLPFPNVPSHQEPGSEDLEDDTHLRPTTPGRYVHGEPLHNVMEEGSEEGQSTR